MARVKRGSTLPAGEIDALLQARHPEPRSVLGYHEQKQRGKTPLCTVRVLEPGASEVSVFWEDEDPDSATPLKRLHAEGLFEGQVRHRRPLHPYRLRVRYPDGQEQTRHDPYYFSPQLTEYDLYLFGEGNHHRAYLKLGAHLASILSLNLFTQFGSTGDIPARNGPTKFKGERIMRIVGITDQRILQPVGIHPVSQGKTAHDFYARPTILCPGRA